MIDIDGILHPQSQEFIQKNLQKDPAQLMLKGGGVPGISLRDLISQIKARQVVKSKLPHWSAQSAVVFPDSVPVQQCSSQATALYKSSLIEGESLLDLTGGLGVDSYYFSQKCQQVTYIEASEDLCRLAMHNFGVLGSGNIKVIHGDCQQVLQERPSSADIIYADPARRKSHAKVYRLEHCQPNILDLLPEIWKNTHRLLLKLSPLMDIKQLIAQIKFACEIHIVSLENDCKEVLLVAEKGYTKDPLIKAVEISGASQYTTMMFTQLEERQARAAFHLPLDYLYEPFVSVLKAGAFKLLCSRYGVYKLHPNSHLYTSKNFIKSFPGRKFKIQWTKPYKKSTLKSLLKNNRANISVRNFPYSAPQIYCATGIDQGGDHYLFATTNLEGRPVVICGNRLTHKKPEDQQR